MNTLGIIALTVIGIQIGFFAGWAAHRELRFVPFKKLVEGKLKEACDLLDSAVQITKAITAIDSITKDKSVLTGLQKNADGSVLSPIQIKRPDEE